MTAPRIAIILLVALAELVGQAAAGCSTDANGFTSCDSGLSWTSRIWIIVAAAVIFIASQILLVWYLRRRHRNKQRLPPAAPGAIPYERGQYWAERRNHLPNYMPPQALLPVIVEDRTMSEARASSAIPRMYPVPTRWQSRSSELPPKYDAAPSPPLFQQSRAAASEVTLTSPHQ